MALLGVTAGAATCADTARLTVIVACAVRYATPAPDTERRIMVFLVSWLLGVPVGLVVLLWMLGILV